MDNTNNIKTYVQKRVYNKFEKKYVLHNFPWDRTAVYLSVGKKFVFTLNL
jgi:hypothetical protein